MGKKLRVAFLNKYQENTERGLETFVNELSKRLSPDFDVDVISKINYLKLLSNRYDVIIPTNGRVQVVIVRIISWVTNTKVVVSGQSGLGADDKWNLLCMPDIFVALTKHQERWAKDFKSNINTRVIPNGVDLKKFNTKSKTISLDLPKPIVLSVGALEDIKRQDLIIKAVAKTKASLLIVGKGNKEKELRELGKNYLLGRFDILNFRHAEMPNVYKAADVFTYPTQPWESFGIVMLEAMASGLPIVANNDLIRGEIVGQAGMLVNPENTDEYGKVLENVLDRKWGDVPRIQAEKFNWDEIANKYKRLFEEIC